MSGAPWTEACDATLRQLWAEGRSTAEIGRRMGISKNAVIGRARRIGLRHRPSPIRPRDPNRPVPSRPRPVLGFSRAFPAGGQQGGRDQPAGGDFSRLLRAAIGRHKLPRTTRLGALAGPLGPAFTCQYPLWPDDLPRPPRQARFCGAPSAPGQSWCAACGRIVWSLGTAAERAAAAAP